MARNSLERWRSTRIATGSVTSAAPRGSSSRCPSSSASGPSRPICDQPERSAGRTKKTTMKEMTVQPNEITEVLNRPISQELLAHDLTPLAYVAKDGTPRNVPIIFTWNGSQIVMCTSKNAPHWGLAGRGERPTLRRRGARGKRLVLPHSQPARYGSCLTSTPLRGDVHNRRRR